MQDYTINDAHKDGFECGLLYVLRYFHEVEEIDIKDSLILRLAEHLGEKKPWRPEEVWADLIHNNMDRW